MTLIKRWNSEQKALLVLLAVSALLLLLGLGSRELWGPETRWANIALQMLQSGDYLDPYLKGSPYYDKPLPSYWLITASAGLMGGLMKSAGGLSGKAIGDAMAVLGRLEKIGVDREALKRLLPAARDLIRGATGRDWLGEVVKTVPGVGPLLGN